jgi:hypothetical protein
MTLVQSILLAIVISPLIAAAFVIAERVARAFQMRVPTGSFGAVLGIGLGFMAGYLAFRGWPSFPPTDALEWLPAWTVLLIAFGLFEASVTLPWWVSWTVRALLTAAITAVVLYPVRERWGYGSLALIAVGLEAGILLAWGSLESLASNSRGTALPALFSVLGIAFFAVVVFSAKFLLLNVLTSALMESFVAITLVSIRWNRSPVARGGISIATGLLAAVAMMGYFYAELHAASPICLGLVPIAIAAGRIAPGRGPARRVRIVVVSVVAVALLGAAIWFADPGAFFAALAEGQY